MQQHNKPKNKQNSNKHVIRTMWDNWPHVYTLEWCLLQKISKTHTTFITIINSQMTM